MISENPFWLIAALLLGIAFWHSTLARGASSVNRCDPQKSLQKGPGVFVCGRSTLKYEVIYNKSKIINVDRVVFFVLILSWVDLDCFFC